MFTLIPADDDDDDEKRDRQRGESWTVFHARSGRRRRRRLVWMFHSSMRKKILIELGLVAVATPFSNSRKGVRSSLTKSTERTWMDFLPCILSSVKRNPRRLRVEGVAKVWLTAYLL